MLAMRHGSAAGCQRVTHVQAVKKEPRPGCRRGMMDRHGGETDLTPHSSPVRTAATLLAWHRRLAVGELAAAQLGYQPFRSVHSARTRSVRLPGACGGGEACRRGLVGAPAGYPPGGGM